MFGGGVVNVSTYERQVGLGEERSRKYLEDMDEAIGALTLEVFYVSKCVMN